MSHACTDDTFKEAPGCDKWDSGLYKALDHGRRPLVNTNGWDSGLHKVVDSPKRTIRASDWDKTLPKSGHKITSGEEHWAPKVFPRRQTTVHEDGWDSGLHKIVPNDPPRSSHVGGWDSGLYKTLANEGKPHSASEPRVVPKTFSQDPDLQSRRPAFIRRDAWALEEHKVLPSEKPKDLGLAVHGKPRAIDGTGWDSGLYKTLPNPPASSGTATRSHAPTDFWEAGTKILGEPRGIYRIRGSGQRAQEHPLCGPDFYHVPSQGRRFAYSQSQNISQILF